MAEYTYTREIVSGNYNIGDFNESSTLQDEIRVVLPGKNLSYINCNGTDVKIGIDTLDAGEKIILDTAVQDHKDNYSSNFIKTYKLTGEYTINTELNINLFGLYREDIFNSRGELITKNYYKNYDGITYSDLIVKDEYVYTSDPNNDLVQYRDETLSWYLEDGTIGKTKVIKKYYDLVNAINEGIKRRGNLLDKAKAYGLVNIQGTHASGVPNSYYWFSTMDSVVVNYINGTVKQDIIDFIDNETETYVTQTIKDTMTDILDYWT
jgi:hypothetical protein